ncbi:MAG: multidrug effflux MFS transporter [Paracoccaceae bacterium]
MTDTGATFGDKRTPPVLITLILLTSVSVFSMNAFIASLPALANDLGTSYGFMQLAVSGYLGMTALMQLVIGPLSDRYGRRPVILIGLTVFIFASLGCVFAEDGQTFMMFRMLQASVAAGMVLSRTIVRDLLPPNEAASMIGYMTAAMSLVPMIGPLYGGAMEEALGWRATFWSFVFFGSVVLVLCWNDLGETHHNRSRSLTAQFRAYPDLLRSRRFWGYAATAAFASGSFFALLGGGPYVAREIFQQTPAATGLYLGTTALGYMSGNLITGRVAGRIGINRLMLWGCAITCAGLTTGLLVDLFILEHPLVVFGFCIFVGLGNGLTMPAATTGLLSVRPGLAGSASGLGASLMIGGGAALSAVAGALLSPTSGAAPLLALMLFSAVMSVIATLYVIRRARAVGAAQPGM